MPHARPLPLARKSKPQISPSEGAATRPRGVARNACFPSQPASSTDALGNKLILSRYCLSVANSCQRATKTRCEFDSFRCFFLAGWRACSLPRPGPLGPSIACSTFTGRPHFGTGCTGASLKGRSRQRGLGAPTGKVKNETMSELLILGSVVRISSSEWSSLAYLAPV